MDINVIVIDSSGNQLDLLISGEVSVEEIEIAFEDGLRNHFAGVLVDSQNSLSKLPDGDYKLTCCPFYTNKRERVIGAICYELRRELLNPVRTTH